MDEFRTDRPDPELMQAVGRRLRALRGRETILSVAERTGLDRTTVSRAEHGDNPTLLTLIRLLRAYGRIPALDGFIPESEVSPMALVRDRRARESAGRGSAGPESASPGSAGPESAGPESAGPEVDGG